MFNHDSKVPNSKTCKSSNTFHSDKPNAKFQKYQFRNVKRTKFGLDKIAKVATKNSQNRQMAEFTKKISFTKISV